MAPPTPVRWLLAVMYVMLLGVAAACLGPFVRAVVSGEPGPIAALRAGMGILIVVSVPASPRWPRFTEVVRAAALVIGAAAFFVQHDSQTAIFGMIFVGTTIYVKAAWPPPRPRLRLP